MKRILRWVGAFVGVALLGFLGGFLLQWTKVTEAREARVTCENTLGDQSKTLETQAATLSLYRAHHEIARNNFGLAGDHLQQAKTRLGSAGVTGDSVANVERAAALVAANDATAIEPIQKAIGALEAPSK